MLGFLLRLLPFRVREPLLILVGSVFGVRIMYLAVRDHDRVPAVIGAVFLVATALRVHMVVRTLRARRRTRRGGSVGGDLVGGADAPTDGKTTARAPVPAGVAAPPVPERTEKQHRPWLQAGAALALFGALAASVWLAPRVTSSQGGVPEAASCADGEHEELPRVYRGADKPVTGVELCEALNRPGLAGFLGTPGETATTVSSSNGTAPLTGGRVARPEAEVAFDTYTINVSVTYDDLSTAQYVKLTEFGGETSVRTLTVLGRPAVLSSDHTMKLEIDLGSGGSGGPVGEGPPARTLTVALDHEDRGGYCDITVWSATGALPDDGALLDIAAKVLPRIPERPARPA
ncbi:DUF6215 domain-containing protein [Streptomyces sp. NPDC048566]|uniref:DUF6215 domain-containing protein n=1 Tax=Streptomyces sp. NPDC048566 TaxID=3365569 RepID=UPI0037180DBA